MDYVIYALVILALGGTIYLFRKFKVSEAENTLLALVLETVDFLNSRFDWKYSKPITNVIKYCQEALEFVVAENATTNLDELQKDILYKAQSLCEENGIAIDLELSDLLTKIISTLIGMKKM